MKIAYILRLAIKNLRGHKLRTLLTAGGVAISVGFIVFLVSLGLGLQQVSTKQIANLDALRVLDVLTGKSRIVSINDETIEKFRNLGAVTEAEPQVSLASQLKYKTSEIDGVIYGKNLEFINLEEFKLLEGRKYSSNSAAEGIINLAGQTQLDANDILGKEVTVGALVKNELLGQDEKTKRIDLTFTVVGIIDDKSAPYMYVPLDVLKKEGIKNYSGAKVKVAVKEDVDMTKLQIESIGLKVSSIKDTVDQINQFFGIFQIVLVAFGSIAIIVSCLGMFNTLTITLLEKTREVGFMKALGTTKRDIYRLFIFESLLIGLIGSVVGVTIGVLLGSSLNVTIAGLAKATGNQAVQLFYAPLYLLIFTITSAIAISFFTGLYPASRASRINALDAIRYE